MFLSRPPSCLTTFIRQIDGLAEGIRSMEGTNKAHQQNIPAGHPCDPESYGCGSCGKKFPRRDNCGRHEKICGRKKSKPKNKASKPNKSRNLTRALQQTSHVHGRNGNVYMIERN